MRIRVLRNLGRGLPDLTEGQVADVDDQAGELLCKRGLAVQIQAIPKPTVKAVLPEPVKAVPDGSVEKAEADLVKYRDKQKKKAETSE